MKNLLSILFVFISATMFGQLANPNIDLSINPISIPLNSNATLTAVAANFGTGGNIVANSLRMTITVGLNAEILSIDPSSSSNWTLLSNTTGSGNTFRLKNIGSILDFQQDDIKLVVKGVAVAGPSNILGNITYIAGANPLLTPPTAPSSSQGNVFTTDDNAVTSLTVIPSLVVTAVATIGATTITAIPCKSGSATLNVAASGGASPMTYSLDGVLYQSGTTFPVVAGSYTVYGKDANSLVATTVISISEPLLTLSATSSLVNPICNGATGVVTVNATGGTSPYTGSGAQTAQIAGTYNYTVTDANGCVTTISATITQPNAVIASASVVNATCNGGTGVVTINATGGTGSYAGSGAQMSQTAGSYSYTVTDANGCPTTISATISQPSIIIVSAIATTTIACNGQMAAVAVSATGGGSAYTSGIGTFNVTAGSNVFTITNTDGCTGSTTLLITQPNPFVLSLKSQIIKCHNQTAIDTLSVSGGTGAATYSITSSSGITTATTTIIENVAAGSYTYTAMDANGCTSSVMVTHVNPTALTLSGTYPPITCFGGTTTLTGIPGGGTPPYSYGSNCNITSNVFPGLPAPAASLILCDANGCKSTISVAITQPSQVLVSVVVTNPIICNGGTATVTVSASGGTPAYMSTGTFTANAGLNSYSVTDANSCPATGSITVTNPAIITNNVNVSSCNTVTLPNGAIKTMSGSYPVTYINGVGCDSLVTYEVIINVASAPINVVLSAVCAPNTVTLPNGDIKTMSGSYPVTYLNSASCDSIVTYVVTIKIPSTSTNIVLPAVCAPNTVTLPNGDIKTMSGSYSVTYLNGVGCDSMVTYAVTINPIPAIVLTAITPSCFGKNNGSIAASISGGASVTSYSVSPSLVQPSFGNFGNAVAGSYVVQAIDVNGCSGSSAIVLSQPSSIVFNPIVSNIPTCNGAANGALFASVIGGASPYNYSLVPNNGIQPTSGNFVNLVSAIYVVKATDANGCTKSLVLPLAQPAALKFSSITKTNVDCFGKSTGSITAITTGGVGVRALSISPSATAASATSFGTLAANTYVVTVTDGNSCIKTTSVVITQASQIVWSPVIVSPATSGSNGTIVVAVSGGTGVKTYLLTPAIGTQSPAGTFNNLVVGTYTVKATDSKGCTVTTTSIIATTSIVINSGIIEKISESAEIDNSINVFPNPTIGPVSVSFSAMKEQAATILVLDLSGKILRRVEVNLNKGDNVVQLDLTDIANGTYLIQVIDLQKRTSAPVIKQ
jgi:Secretion system C-terminal sorting domain/SprB repeat